MCIDFLKRFPTCAIYDYLRKLPTCAMIFCGSFQHMQSYFWGSSPHVNIDVFFSGVSCLAEVPNMSINTAGKFPTCPSFSGRRSQHVHGFSGGVPPMRMLLGGKIRIPNVHRYFFGKFQMSNDILGYFSHDQLFWK